jgi:microsomal prostaglandin-E synthase 2
VFLILFSELVLPALLRHCYDTMPPCCTQLPYHTVEVNPLTKGELSWSTYRKVPVVKLDNEVVVDSSAIISRLAAEMQAKQGKSSSPRGSASGW